MKTYTIKITAAFALLALALVANAQHDDPDPLAMDAAAIEKAGIVIDTLALRALRDELKAPGEVTFDAYSTVLVSPRVASQVIERNARLGDLVHAGDALVRLSSVEVAETQGALIVAEQDWQRIAALGPRAVSARRYNQARVVRDQAMARLRAYGLSDAQIRNLLKAGSARADGSYDLLAPIGGRITSDEFLVGERIEPGRTLFTLVDEERVWVEAQLAPADAEKVAAGDVARIAIHAATLEGRVIRRAHQTNERTRTVSVRIEVANRDDLLHAGELVEVRIATGGDSARLALPAEAVVLLDNQPTVFRARAGQPFEPVAVIPGETRDGWTVLREGLTEGERYVRKGAFVLKARLLRSQLGDHH